jgi:hypothetical protein
MNYLVTDFPVEYIKSHCITQQILDINCINFKVSGDYNSSWMTMGKLIGHYEGYYIDFLTKEGPS